MKKKNATRPDGRIAVSIYLGKDESGKRKYKAVYGKTQKEANAKALEIRLQMNKGIDVGASKGTFEEWGKRLITAKKADVCQKSVESYQTYLNHLNKYFGDKQLDKITTDNIQAVINDFSENNPRTVKPASQRMLKGLKITALQVFEKAIEARAIYFNPVMYVRIPKTAPKSHRNALSNEYQQYVNNTPHALQTACMIALNAGLRKGEVLALNWSDINLEQKTITVNKSVEYNHNIPNLKDSAKTKAGIRVVDIPQVLVYYLQSTVKSSLLVCPGAHGALMLGGEWERLWADYMGELESRYYSDNSVVFNRFTFHSLRHSYISNCYMAGVDVETTMQQAGHSDIKTTLGVYTHLDSEHKRKSMEKLNTYLDASQMQVSK